MKPDDVHVGATGTGGECVGGERARLAPQALETALRNALRPVAPEPRFSLSLAARLQAARRPEWQPRLRRRWQVAALAASVLMAAGIGWRAHLQQERGAQARAQLLQALAITSHSLHQAWQAVNAPADGG